MDIYLKRRRWKTLLLFIAVLIGVASLAYTNWLTKEMAEEERKKVELWAEATLRFAEPEIPGQEQLSTTYSLLILKILEQNTAYAILKKNKLIYFKDNIC